MGFLYVSIMEEGRWFVNIASSAALNLVRNFYYTIEGIEDCDGNIINLLFTKRELLVAKEKYKKFYKK